MPLCNFFRACLLAAMLESILGDSNDSDPDTQVSVVRNGQILKSFDSLTAEFGPGYFTVQNGYVLITKLSGCRTDPIPPVPPKYANDCFLMMPDDHRCPYDEKVYNAQEAGYKSAIIFSQKSESLVRMPISIHAGQISIQSVYVGRIAGLYFQRSYNLTIHEDEVIISDNSVDNRTVIIIIIAVSCMIFVVIFAGLVIIACLVQRWRRNRPTSDRERSRRRRFVKNNIPVVKFKDGDAYDLCAICLDDFKVGDKLRVLPCSHAYHVKCIDPWLTQDSELCPLCKRSIFGEQPDTEEDAEPTVVINQPTADNEQTPLVAASQRRRDRHRRRRFHAHARVVRSPYPRPEPVYDGSDDDENVGEIPVVTNVQVHRGNPRTRIVTSAAVASGYGAIGGRRSNVNIDPVAAAVLTSSDEDSGLPEVAIEDLRGSRGTTSALPGTRQHTRRDRI